MSQPIHETLPDDAASPSEPSFGDLLSEYERDHRKTSETISATVITVGAEFVYADVGRKHEGAIPLDVVRDAAGNVTLKPGDILQCSISGRDENGYYTLSLFKVIVPKDWSGLQKAFEEKAVITGTVEELIKGGLRVDVGVRAFMPASRSGARDVPEMEKLVGQTVECRITKLDTDSEDVVVDRRVVLEDRALQAKEESFGALREGTVITGTVRNVMDFGAFVDLGGVDGLLHVSDMSWVRSVKPADVVKVGDQVQVKILKVDAARRKVSLGLKQLQPEPWTLALQAIKVGDRVQGKVARVTDFGAFVELSPGVEGMVHVSEMSWAKKFKRPQDIVKVGDVVEVVVLGVKPEERRIALGLKQVMGDPWEEAKLKYTVGAVVEAPVVSLQSFGVFVGLGEGIEGMIHIGDITNEKRLQHPKEMLKDGQLVKAQVVEVDQERRRIKLSMKKLEPTSADEYLAENTVGAVVTGRVADVSATTAKIDLAEGVRGVCRLKAVEAAAVPATAGGGGVKPADLGSLAALLGAKWKSGAQSPAASTGGSGQLRVGEVRRFAIIAADAAKKLIELELRD